MPDRRTATPPLLRSPALAAALLLAAALPAAGGEIQVADAYPLRGQATTVEVSEDGVPAAGAVVEVLYRPNSATSHTETLPPADGAGRVEWVPADAGIVTLTARRPGAAQDAPALATLNVAVRYGGFPARGLATMIVAGLLLFGGAALGFWFLLSSTPPAVEPPST